MSASNTHTFNTHTFLESLRMSDQEIVSPAKICELLRLSVDELAQRALVHPSIVKLRPASSRLQEFLRGLAEVLELLLEITDGDTDRAVYTFLNQPIREFDYLTLDQVVARGRSLSAIDFLRSVAGGPTG